MRIVIYISVLMLIATSCSSDKKEKVVDINDIMPQSKRNYNQNKTGNNDSDTMEIVKHHFTGNAIFVNSVSPLETKQIPDRVGPISSERYRLNFDLDTLEYYQWTFRDSARVFNSFYNWLDIFNVEQVGAEVNFQKKAMNIFIGDTTIIYITGKNVNSKMWIHHLDMLGYESNWHYLIEQKSALKAKWYRFEEGEKVEFKIEEE